MHTYIAKLVFRIEVLNEKHRNQYEEKFIAVKAHDTELAYIKSIELAYQSETEFINENRHHLRWSFIGITHLFPIGELSENSELFSEIKENYTENETRVLAERIHYISNQFTACQNE
jgi:hypothetical protein